MRSEKEEQEEEQEEEEEDGWRMCDRWERAERNRFGRSNSKLKLERDVLVCVNFIRKQITKHSICLYLALRS